jgi:hypothetical protein
MELWEKATGNPPSPVGGEGTQGPGAKLLVGSPIWGLDERGNSKRHKGLGFKWFHFTPKPLFGGFQQEHHAFLTSTEAYLGYVSYWNEKVKQKQKQLRRVSSNESLKVRHIKPDYVF